MTCKAVSFGVFTDKRLKTDAGLVAPVRRQHLPLLMCGTKHKSGPAELCSLRKTVSTFQHVTQLTCRQTRSTTALTEVVQTRPVTLSWLKKRSNLHLPPTSTESLGKIPLDSRLVGRKRNSSEDSSIVVISPKRKKQDNIHAQLTAENHFASSQQLQPLSYIIDQSIPFNNDDRDEVIEVDGTLHSAGVSYMGDVQLSAWSSLQLSDFDSVEARLEKERRYREGLENGMKDFLTQTLPATSEIPSVSNHGAGTLVQMDPSAGQEVARRSQPNVHLTEESQMMLEAAQGFILMVDKQLRILYVTDNVQQHLGHDQVNMIGQSLEDYLHPKDVEVFVTFMKDETIDTDITVNLARKRMFYVGMKFSFQKPGSRHKDAGYTFVQWNGKFQLRRTKENVQVQHLVALCRPVRTDSVLELRLDGNMFISRHDLGFHFIYCDPRIINLIGYEPSELIGRTVYQFHCPRDLLICKQCHKLLIVSGSSKSDYYRFLSRSGKWVWLYTHATIVYDTTQKPQYIVCKNYVISEREARQKLAEECKEFTDMKCLGFSLETDLPGVDQLTTSGRSLSHYLPEEDDGEALVKELLSTEPVDVTNNPYACPRKKRNLGSVTSNMGAKDVGRPVTDVQSSQVSLAAEPVAMDTAMSTYDQLFTAGSPMADTSDVFNFSTSDDFTISFTDMLEASMGAESKPSQTSLEALCDDGLLSGLAASTTADVDVSTSFTGLKDKQTDILEMMDLTPTTQFSCTSTMSNVHIKTTTNTYSRNISVLPTILPANSQLLQSNNATVTSRASPGTYSHISASSRKLLSLLSNNNNLREAESSCPPRKKANVTILKDVVISQNTIHGKKHFTVIKSSGHMSSEALRMVEPIRSAMPASSGQAIGMYMNNVADDVSDVMTNGLSDPFLCQLTEPYLLDEEDLCPKDLTDVPMLSLTPASDDQLSDKLDVESSSSGSSCTLSDPTFSPANLKELDTYLNMMSPSSESLLPLNDSLDAHNIPFSDQMAFTSDQEISQSIRKTPVSLPSNESSSDSDTGRPSLLRTLLDNEGEAIQGPLTYKEWILAETLSKKNEMKKSKMSRGSPKHTVSVKPRGNKPVKSTELPLPGAQNFIYKKDPVQSRQPTRELPLPVSAAQKQKYPQESQPACSSTASNEINLPDDLLDLAVEYCATLGADQAEALLSDFNDSPSLEDTLYSFIASPAYSKSSFSGNKHISVLESSQTSLGNDRGTSTNKCDISLGNSAVARSNSAMPSGNRSVSSVSSDSGKMSLLRAAVTSPDVDKLIEQIPFGNILSFPASDSKSPNGDPDIFITKVNGLQKVPAEPDPLNQMFKVPCVSSMRSCGKTSPSKSFQSSGSLLSTSDHIDAILFDHFYTTSISASPTSPQSPSLPASSSKVPPSRLHHQEPFTVKVSRTLHNKPRSHPNSPRPLGVSNPNSPRAAGVTNGDISSSTHPISVTIMKKDHHRSRRSKSIGLQTDNEPGEVYPEFERSPTDVILYPSVCHLTSPSNSDSSGTASLSSSPTMSELEKYLRGFSSHEENSSSAFEDSNRSKRGTPFLQKLLTGELSNDNYQRLDQQLLERERRESVSSGSSDYDLN